MLMDKEHLMQGLQKVSSPSRPWKARQGSTHSVGAQFPCTGEAGFAGGQCQAGWQQAELHGQARPVHKPALQSTR